MTPNFASNLSELSRPDWANVICQNIKDSNLCYAFQDSTGNLGTGYLMDDDGGVDSFSTGLTKDQWNVIPLGDENA